MSKAKRKFYWDSSCFICFLNADETDRRLICEDVLLNARDDKVEIWISMWVMVEVIRPRRPGNEPLPKWAMDAIKAVPAAKEPLEELWKRHQNASPTPKLTPEQIREISAMFQWKWIKKIYLDERIAKHAIEIARDYGLKPGDAVHVASALAKQCEAIHVWDKDFDKVKGLIDSSNPQYLSDQARFAIPGFIGPTPEIMNDKSDDDSKVQQRAAQRLLSLSPLTFQEAVSDILKVKPQPKQAKPKANPRKGRKQKQQ